MGPMKPTAGWSYDIGRGVRYNEKDAGYLCRTRITDECNRRQCIFKSLEGAGEKNTKTEGDHFHISPLVYKGNQNYE